MAISRQRHRFDHDAAKAFYVALDPPRRYSDIARKFAVSLTTIRKVAIAEEWQAAALEADERAAAKALAGAFRTREQRTVAVLRITDRLIDHFLDNAEAKALEASFGDVDRMVKLAELLLGEATDRVSVTEARGLIGQVVQLAGKWAAADAPVEVRRAGLMADVKQLVAAIPDDEGGIE